MNQHLLYIVINDGWSERVTQGDIDAAEQAGIVDRTLLQVLETGNGWADSRRSGYTVTGSIRSNAATFVLHDEGVPIATLGVCLKQKAGPGVWSMLRTNAAGELPDIGGTPQPPWAALRYDVPETALPPWLDWWAKNVGFALMTREGW